MYTSVSNFPGNRFSVEKTKIARLQILLFASKGHMPDCITILMMFALTKQKCGLLLQVMSPFDIFRLIIRHFSLQYL